MMCLSTCENCGREKTAAPAFRKQPIMWMTCERDLCVGCAKRLGFRRP